MSFARSLSVTREAKTDATPKKILTFVDCLRTQMNSLLTAEPLLRPMTDQRCVPPPSNLLLQPARLIEINLLPEEEREMRDDDQG